MKYLDSGARDPAQALGHWLDAVLRDGDVAEVRWQSGFYTADGVGFLAPTLERIRDEGGRVTALVGSNNGDTLRVDVERLLPLLGVPRPGACLGVVSFAGAFFHPKTYHLTRRDGSQAGYVGSANLTAAGVGSLHVEAGVVLDSREGDSVVELSRIAAATDAWFSGGGRAGLSLVEGPTDIARLVAEGILAEQPPPRAVNQGGGGNAAVAQTRPRLQALVRVPVWGPRAVAPGPPTPGGATAPAGGSGPAAPTRASTARPGLPAYILFDPAATSPTVGAAALSGTPLPGRAVGLIVRLTRDSARHFAGQKGTANISLPVNTLATLRFGLFRREYERPRAEYGLQARYIGGGRTFRVDGLATNVMAYGYIRQESGHQNVRMVLPATLRALAERATAVGLPVPAAGDLALLEWPTEQAPEFRITFPARGGSLLAQALERFDAEAAAGRLVVDGAAWLPPGLSPAW